MLALPFPSREQAADDLEIFGASIATYLEKYIQ
jgi:hypothetical protein